ncbi:cytochrome P450 [Schizopora paradoxa]|uniref:Cytochrome P450 n=1 Tax=Schizopora paradoxa TaxID=27342 RepID=A0A0H2RMA4_9AGAM|nr:cytochrome P450 [Schizopora paradoxa]
MPSYRTSLLDVYVVCASILSFILLRCWNRRHRFPLPPGPPRLPILGNMFQFPATRQWEKALDWGKTYGDMIYLEIAGKPMPIVNSHRVAVDLLTKRSANYSSRPQFVILQLTGWAWVTSLIPYGESLRKQRAIFHRFFLSREALNYGELQENECRLFLRRMLERPESYGSHVRCLIAGTVGLITYGHEVGGEDDRYIELGEKSGRVIGEAMDYLYLDFFPWNKHSL